MTAYKIDPRRAEAVELSGPTLRFLTPEAGEAPSVMLGTVPPGAVVPLHSHPDPETFLALAGTLTALAGEDWIPVGPGEIWHVPGNVRHAFRNDGDEPAVMYIVSTATITRFFREVSAAPERFEEISRRYGYWNAPSTRAASR